MFCFFKVQDDGHTLEILFSSGVDLTDNQMEMFNAIMMAFGSGVQAVYVHCLSQSDIFHNYMVFFYPFVCSDAFMPMLEGDSVIDFVYLFLQRIPKSICEAINIPESGVAMLLMNQDDWMQDEFVRCADGRPRFTSGWHHFALYYDLVPTLDVIMLHSMNNA